MNAINSRMLLTPSQLDSQRGLYKAASMAFVMHLLALIGVASAAHLASSIVLKEINTITATLQSPPSIEAPLEKKALLAKTQKLKLKTPLQRVAQAAPAAQDSKPETEREMLTTLSSALETVAHASTTVAAQSIAIAAAAVQAKAETPAAQAQPVVSTPVIFDAAYLNNPPPQYPAVSRLRGESGTTYLRVQISSEGKAMDVNVSQSSGSSKLDQAAVSAVSKWRFIPATRSGVAMTSWVKIPIAFTLNQ